MFYYLISLPFQPWKVVHRKAGWEGPHSGDLAVHDPSYDKNRAYAKEILHHGSLRSAVETATKATTIVHRQRTDSPQSIHPSHDECIFHD